MVDCRSTKVVDLSTSIDPAVKTVLLYLLDRGAITILEAAELGCVSHQAVRKWVRRRRWNMDAKRKGHVTALFRRTLTGRKANSKEALRKDAREASEAWEWRHGREDPR